MKSNNNADNPAKGTESFLIHFLKTNCIIIAKNKDMIKKRT